MKVWSAFAGAFIFILCVAAFYLYFGPFISTGQAMLPGDFIVIERGMTLRQIGEKLEEKNVIRSNWLFYSTGRLTGLDRKVKAGHYRFSGEESLHELFYHLQQGDYRTQRVTLPEGLMGREIAGILARELDIDSAAFMFWFRNDSLLKAYGIQAKDFEGYLLPDTYDFYLGQPEKALLTRLVDENFKVWQDSGWTRRLPDINMTRQEIMTLASIVEGEAQVDSERPVIAGLYYNRLKRGIRLQADPTIQYLLPDGPRRILYKDLAIQSPYNTYLKAGLPPGPIGNPGKKSIQATLFPAKHSYLYMVADGYGGHVFTQTLRDHNRAVENYKQLMAPRRRAERLKGNE